MTAATAPVTAAPPAGASWSRSLLGTVISLIATTGVTSVLGVAFWWLAAHRASLSTVGNGSAAVSAMTLVATFGMAGLNTTLIPHLARRSRHGDGLLAAGLCVSALVSAPACARRASTPCPRCGPPSRAASGGQPGTRA
jgi:hypothetical protein